MWFIIYTPKAILSFSANGPAKNKQFIKDF